MPISVFQGNTRGGRPSDCLGRWLYKALFLVMVRKNMVNGKNNGEVIRIMVR